MFVIWLLNIYVFFVPSITPTIFLVASSIVCSKPFPTSSTSLCVPISTSVVILALKSQPFLHLGFSTRFLVLPPFRSCVLDYLQIYPWPTIVVGGASLTWKDLQIFTCTKILSFAHQKIINLSVMALVVR